MYYLCSSRHAARDPFPCCTPSTPDIIYAGTLLDVHWSQRLGGPANNTSRMHNALGI